MVQVLEREVHPLLSGFYDTPFIVWLLKTRPEYWEKTYLEDEISLNRHWLQFESGAEEVATLITHYAGGPSPPQAQNAVLVLLCIFTLLDSAELKSLI